MKALFCAMALFAACLQSAAAQTVIEVALPTAPDHLRNRVLESWVRNVALQSSNRITIQLRHGATRYEGSGIVNVVAEGAFDMAVPGWWHISRIVPEFRVSALPMFYGQSRETVVGIFDGALGQELDGLLEQTINVKVLGRRIELGAGHLYVSTRKVVTQQDIDGLNIRVPGGSSDLARYLAFGAIPRRVALTELKGALRNGLVDGLLTTHSYVLEAALLDAGVKFAFLDRELFYQYTPIINRARWESFSADERALLAETWERAVDGMRRAAIDAQAGVMAALVQQGIEYVEPSPESLKAARDKLMLEQPALVTSLGMRQGFVDRVSSALPGVSLQK